MNKEQYNLIEKYLLDKGYTRGNGQLRRADWCLYKAFGKNDNIWEEDRSLYQILLYVYDYGSISNVPKEYKDKVGIEVDIMVSRTIDENLNLITDWRFPDTTIMEIENLAEDFYKFVCNRYPNPEIWNQ